MWFNALILLNSNESLELVNIYPPNLEDNDFKAFFNYGDSPNLPATSKKAALSSRARVWVPSGRSVRITYALPSRACARFVNLPAQGWHYCKNLQFSDFAIGINYVMISS